MKEKAATIRLRDLGISIYEIRSNHLSTSSLFEIIEAVGSDDEIGVDMGGDFHLLPGMKIPYSVVLALHAHFLQIGNKVVVETTH